MKQELYRLTDSFLVEATNAKGEHRSLERLNADRHLFVENVMELIHHQIASAVEARESKIGEHILAIGHNDECMFCGFKDKFATSIINPSKE